MKKNVLVLLILLSVTFSLMGYKGNELPAKRDEPSLMIELDDIKNVVENQLVFGFTLSPVNSKPIVAFTSGEDLELREEKTPSSGKYSASGEVNLFFRVISNNSVSFILSWEEEFDVLNSVSLFVYKGTDTQKNGSTVFDFNPGNGVMQEKWVELSLKTSEYSSTVSDARCQLTITASVK